MTMDPYSIVLYPFVTEKSMSHMEKNNALEFVVKRTANKELIKKAVEQMFAVKVKSVNTRITRKENTQLSSSCLNTRQRISGCA